MKNEFQIRTDVWFNQPTVTKLMDRGTWQALGIVSDVGAFLPMVANAIGSK